MSEALREYTAREKIYRRQNELLKARIEELESHSREKDASIQQLIERLEKAEAQNAADESLMAAWRAGELVVSGMTDNAVSGKPTDRMGVKVDGVQLRETPGRTFREGDVKE